MTPGPGYKIELADVAAHRYRVTLTLQNPAAEQQLSLPVWIPGSYLVREFAKHLSGMNARQAGRDLPVQQIDKASWRVRCEGGAALEVRYDIYAFDASVRTAWLDSQRAFFNPGSLCLRAHGREAEMHRIELASVPEAWHVATEMPARDAGFEAADYDELVDHPFEIGPHWQGEFMAAGVPHRIVVAGAWPSFDGARLLADVQRICEAQIGFWNAANEAPFPRYSFLLWAVDDGHGGLEHRASTALICVRRELPTAAEGAAPSDAYARLLGLFSHEYFHAWNVKRLRPAEFARFDYQRENYTELLWFFEGFTSYYDELMLCRAGLVDASRYLKLLAGSVNGVLATPGRGVQPLSAASFEAWTKYYRPDENTPNTASNYYAQGALVALC
ncbi:MAG: M61 family peptidase, partial [Rubrivivax sp.]